VGNYVTDNPSNLGNYVTADNPQPDTPDDPDLRPPLTRSPSLNPGSTVGIVVNYWGAP